MPRNKKPSDNDPTLETDVVFTNDSDFLCTQAVQKFNTGDYVGAILDFDKALALDPENGFYLSTKAEILYKMGDIREAHKYIKMALEIEPYQNEFKDDLTMIEAALQTHK